MKAKSGQVALYLVMVLLALAVLMMVNVNAFLAVRSKNRMMNAVDEAAIAVAKHQGALLNEVGQLNVDHLTAAVLGKPWVGEHGESKAAKLRELTFLGPVDAIRISNEVAADWGFAGGEAPQALSGFRDHIQEILENPDLYPPTEEGVNLWHVYAAKLAQALAGEPAVLPSYMEMVNPGSSGLFANAGFYDVLAAKAWCWFSIGDNAHYLNDDPTSVDPYEVRPVEVPANSEVYSLHVAYKTWSESDWWENGGLSEKWTNFVSQVTGIPPPFTNENCYVARENEVWAFYDETWKPWSETYNPDNGYPIAGTIKPEYDVAGCVAACMMLGHIQEIGQDDEQQYSDKTILVTADAKPLGTVEDLDDGGRVPVTAYNGFIAPSRPGEGEKIFTEAHLALVGSVPRAPGCSMEPGWYEHVKKHSPGQQTPGCGYCKLWAEWSQPSFRSQIRSWLRTNAESCRAKGGGGKCEKGGYPYAH